MTTLSLLEIDIIDDLKQKSLMFISVMSIMKKKTLLKQKKRCLDQIKKSVFNSILDNRENQTS